MQWRTRAGAVAALAAGVVLSGCGAADPGSGTRASDDATDAEVVVRGIVMQSSPDARIELCVGPVMESYPPQCRGPELRGEFSWGDVEVQEQGGVRWTDTVYVAVGTFDRAADAFTLTRPLSTDAPPGVTMPTAADVDFPQLCEDPFRGGDPGHPGDLESQERLHQRLSTLDGYVTSWVSDGADLFNVVVTADAEDAHAALREVWAGGLCVERRDLPTAAEVASAQDALNERARELGLMSSASGGTSGLLEVEVMLADAETTALVHEVVAPWLTPEEVSISGAMRPLELPR